MARSTRERTLFLVLAAVLVMSLLTRWALSRDEGGRPSPTRTIASPVSNNRNWLQEGRNGAHSQSGDTGPIPPLKRAWTFEASEASVPQANGAPLHPTTTQTVLGSPIVIGDTIVATGSRVYGVSTDGKLRWTFGSGAGLGFFDPVAIGEEVVVSSLQGSNRTGRVTALDVRTGEIKWSWKVPQNTATWLWLAANTSGIAVVSDTGEVWMLSATGHAMWSASTSPLGTTQAAVPVAADDQSIIIANTRTLECLRASDGHLVWTRHFSSAGQFTPSIDEGKIVAAGPSDIATFDATTGRPIAQRRMPGVLWMIVNGGFVYAQDGSGVHQLSLPDVRTIWTIPATLVPGDIPNANLALAEGILFASHTAHGSQEPFALSFSVPGKGVVWSILLARGATTSLFGGDTQPVSLVSTGTAVYLTTNSGALIAFARAENTNA
jgi:outer membrane protein assembly factor BamB